MSETNKVLLAAILGILVGFGGGRLLESRPFQSGAKDESLQTEKMTESSEIDESLLSEADIGGSGEKETPATEKAVNPILKDKTRSSNVQPANASSNIKVSNQRAGSVVYTAATLDRVGWVVIHEDREGGPGNILGARRFGPGTGAVEVMLLRGTMAGAKYYAMLHNDDGDGMFDFKLDLPLTDSADLPIMASFVAN